MRKRTWVVIVIFVLLGMYFWYRHELSPANGGNDVRSIVTIPSGSSVSSIAQLLSKQGLIRSPFFFSWFVRLHSDQSRLLAGTYVLYPSLSTPEVVNILMGSHAPEMTVTIPEGFTVKDIDALLAAKGLSASGDLLHCAQTCDFQTFMFLPRQGKDAAERGGMLEGYLFPDTYFVTREQFFSKFFVERLLGVFRQRVSVGLAKDIAASGHSLSDIVTMASLVEAETRTDAERPIVAGILWKRYEKHMSLGVDASVRYILGKKSASLTESDLSIDSPYNLRKFRGLPPGPISNPGLSSIEAALHPQASPYFYYLHDANGQIHYAVTNDDQNVNRERFLP